MASQLEEISPNDDLYRRIIPNHVTHGELNAGAFSLRPGEDSLSVDIARLTSVESCLERAGQTDVGLAMLSAGVAMSLGLRIEHDPISAEVETGMLANWAHARIIGDNSRAIRSKLAKASTILVMPAERSYESDVG